MSAKKIRKLACLPAVALAPSGTTVLAQGDSSDDGNGVPNPTSGAFAGVKIPF